MKKAAAAKSCGKVLKTATKSKSLLSKSKTNATEPAGKKVKGKLAVTGTVKKAVLKKKVPIKSKNAAKTGSSKLKPKPLTPNMEDNKSSLLVEEMEGSFRSMETTLTDSTPDLDTLAEKPFMAGGNMKEESALLECTDAENQPETDDSKLKPESVTSETVYNKSAVLVGEAGGEKLAIMGKDVVVENTDREDQPQTGQSEDTSALATSAMLKEIVQGDKPTAFDCNPETVKHIKSEDAEPMQLGETESTDLQEVGNGAIPKEEKSPPLNISAEEQIEKPAAPPAETPPPGNPVKASQHMEENLPGKAQPTAGTTEIKTEALHMKQSGSGVKTQEGMLKSWPYGESPFVPFKWTISVLSFHCDHTN